MGCTHGIQTVYKRFSPSLSKYGVYNSSPLIVLCTCVNIVLCTYSQSCAVHLIQ